MRRERESFIPAVRRRFSAAFKRQVVEELLAGGVSAAQLCRRYELCQTVVRTWKQQYAERCLFSDLTDTPPSAR